MVLDIPYPSIRWLCPSDRPSLVLYSLLASSVHATFSPLLQLDLIASDFPLSQAAYAQYFSLLVACCLRRRHRHNHHHHAAPSHHLVISSSSPSSYSQLNVHFSVKQAVKWHFRCRSSRCFVSFAWLAWFVWPSGLWFASSCAAFLYAA